MIEQFIALYPRGRITYQQTSFLELTTDVEVHRIDFIGKAEARIKRGTYGKLIYVTEHPALLNYNYPQTLITVSVKDKIPAAFLEEYDRCLNKWRNGWRQFAFWTGLSLNSQDRLANSLPRHYYQSLYFPYFIAEEIITLCEQHKIEVNRTSPRLSQPTLVGSHKAFGILCVGSSYVIAHDFYVSTIR